jgi:hypothetical protein
VVNSDTQITAISPSLLPGVPQGGYPVVVSGPTGSTNPDTAEAIFTFAAQVVPSEFIAIPLDVGVALTLVENLRLLLGERIPASGTEADTRFLDDEIATVINRHNGNLYLAAGELWSVKAAIFASLTDVSESGSERKLSQLFRQATQMAQSYTKAGMDFQIGLISRPIAKSARILDPMVGSTFDAAGVPGDFYAQINPYASGTARFWPILTVLV